MCGVACVLDFRIRRLRVRSEPLPWDALSFNTEASVPSEYGAPFGRVRFFVPGRYNIIPAAIYEYSLLSGCYKLDDTLLKQCLTKFIMAEGPKSFL